MTSEVDPEELANRIDELESRLQSLQDDLKTQQLQEGFHIPRPGEILRMTDQHAIPALIAILEAHIHALRLLQRTIRLVSTGRDPGSAPEATGPLDRARRSVRTQLDSLIDDLESVSDASSNPALRELQEEAEEIKSELSDRSDGVEESVAEPTEEASSTEADPKIDVEDELESIKSDLDGPDESDADGSP